MGEKLNIPGYGAGKIHKFTIVDAVTIIRISVLCEDKFQGISPVIPGVPSPGEDDDTCIIG